MINLTISPLVPEYFKKLKIKEYELDNGNIYEILKENLEEEGLQAHMDELEYSIDIYMATGVVTLPIKTDDNLNRYGYKLKDGYYKSDENYINFNLHLKIDDPTDFKISKTFYNLLDNKFYYFDGVELKHQSLSSYPLVKSAIQDKISSYIAFEEFVNQCNYDHHLANKDSKSNEIDLKLYDLWVKHNLNLIKKYG